jgi:diguanylate cyclase (GGDEF)-like protein
MDKRFPNSAVAYQSRDEARLAQFELSGVIAPNEHLKLEQDTFGSRTEAFVFPALMTVTSVFLAIVYGVIAVQMNWHLAAPEYFVTYCSVLAATIALPLGIVASIREYRKWRSHQKIRFVAAVDPLTGLLNRRSFSISIDQELKRMSRTGHAAAVILFDLDRFKHLNDRFGHNTGDEVLTKIASIAYAELRNPFDRLARWGGEEFIILLHDMTEENAKNVCERLRTRIETLLVEHEGLEVAFTASFGGSLLHPNQPFDEALARADAALYDAKAKGRNRVEFKRHLALAK